MEKILLALACLLVISPALAAGDEARLSRKLFPLSPYYGVCLEDQGVLRSSIRSGTYGYASVVDLSYGGAELTLNVGSFMLDPGSAVSTLPKSPRGALVQRVRAGGSSYLFVSNIPGAGSNRVSVHYTLGAKWSDQAALTLANHLVGCRLTGSIH